MTSATDTFEQGLADLIFLNVALTLIGDAAGLLPSAVAGSLYVSAHTADPGEGGTQTTSEATYTGYARAAVARSGSGWVRSGSVVNNVGTVSLGTNSGAQQTITHLGIGASAAGAGKLILRLSLSTPVLVTTSMALQFLENEIAINFT